MARIIRATWPDRLEDTAIAVAGCETGGTYNPRAYNPEVHYDARGRAYVGSWGLFQVAAIHTWAYVKHPRELWNPWRNARAALKVFRRQGWDAWWRCSRKVGAR